MLNTEKSTLGIKYLNWRKSKIKYFKRQRNNITYRGTKIRTISDFSWESIQEEWSDKFIFLKKLPV